MRGTGHGNIGFFEDFQSAIVQTLSDATQYRYNDIRLIAISGDVDMTITVDEPNGIAGFSGAGGAADGIGLTSAPMCPSLNGIITMETRFKLSLLTTWGGFIGWQETVNMAEIVNPFTLSGTTLTSNNGGNAFGIYYDTTADTDDWRVHASIDGTEGTTATVTNSTGTVTTLGALGIRANAVPVVDSFMYIRVEIDPDGAGRVYYGDISTAPSNTGPKLVASLAAGYLDTAALYHPVVILVDPSTNDPTWEVDYFGATGGRDETF